LGYVLDCPHARLAGERLNAQTNCLLFAANADHTLYFYFNNSRC
jgi:hypothetical protein